MTLSDVIDGRRLYTLSQAADKLGVPVHVVENWIEKGLLKTHLQQPACSAMIHGKELKRRLRERFANVPKPRSLDPDREEKEMARRTPKKQTLTRFTISLRDEDYERFQDLCTQYCRNPSLVAAGWLVERLDEEEELIAARASGLAKLTEIEKRALRLEGVTAIE